MQTKDQNEKYETTLFPYLDKELFEGNKQQEVKGKAKKNDLSKLGARCPKAKTSAYVGKISISHSIITLRLDLLNQMPSNLVGAYQTPGTIIQKTQGERQ